jgi:hypothetical protein
LHYAKIVIDMPRDGAISSEMEGNMPKKPRKTETRGRKPKGADKLVPVMTHLPAETVEQLQQLAVFQDRPVSAIVRVATTMYLGYAFKMISGEVRPNPTGENMQILPFMADWVSKGREELGITAAMVEANWKKASR